MARALICHGKNSERLFATNYLRYANATSNQMALRRELVFIRTQACADEASDFF